jgi:predicted amidophosphoribosyltransferase
MQMSVRDYNRKSFSLIIGLGIFVTVCFLTIGLFFIEFGILMLIIIPLIVFFIIGLIIYRYSGESKKFCPRCNVPISIYTEYCRNCGLKLINKCPNCNIYMDGNINYCDNCGYEFPEYEGDKFPFEYKVYEKGEQLSEKPNFCPTCGASLKDAENLRFCEFCGSKIV